MSLLRDGIQTATENDRLLGLSILVVSCELLVRIGLSFGFGSLLVVLFPPVITVLAFGLSCAYTAETGFKTVTEWAGLTAGLLAVAVLGHAVAVVLGGAVFLVVDTPVRVFLYWAGYELLASDLVALGLPFAGLATGTALAWAGPGVVAVSAVTGRRPRETLIALTAHPRTLLAIGLSYVLVVLTPLAVFILSLSLSAVLLRSAVVFLAVFAALFGLCGSISVGSATVVTFRGEKRLADSSPSQLSAVRLGVVLVLVLGLAVTAGAVRTTETRPLHTSPEPLGDEPQNIYETALNNTFDQNHAVVSYPEYPVENTTVKSIHDLEDRQAIVPGGPIRSYETVGQDVRYANRRPDSAVGWLLRTDANQEFRKSPAISPRYVEGYQFRDTLPSYRHDFDWRLVETGDRLVVESSDVAALLETNYVDPVTLNETHTAWVRATVDPDTRTLQSVEYRYNVTLDRESAEPPEQMIVHERWEFSTNVTVRRPEWRSRLSFPQRVWKVLIY